MEETKTFRGGSYRLGFYRTKAVRVDPQLIWKRRLIGKINSTPAIWLGVACVGTDNNAIYGVSVTDGTRLWSIPTDGPVTSSPLVDDLGNGYVGDGAGYLYKFNVQTGDLGSKVGLDQAGFSYSSMLDFQGALYIGAQSGTLYKLDYKLKVIWRFSDEEGMLFSSPAGFYGQKVQSVVIAVRDTVYAVDLSSGQEIWHHQCADNITATPVVFPPERRLYTGDAAGALTALDAETGKVCWSRELGAEIHASPALSRQQQYLVCCDTDNWLRVLNRQTGKLQWFMPMPDSIVASPALTQDGFAYVRCINGILYCVDLQNRSGRVEPDWLWRFPVEGKEIASPVPFNGKVLVAGDRRLKLIGEQR